MVESAESAIIAADDPKSFINSWWPEEGGGGGTEGRQNGEGQVRVWSGRDLNNEVDDQPQEQKRNGGGRWSGKEDRQHQEEQVTVWTTLAALGFAPSSTDPSLFLCTDTTLPLFYVLVYVDSLVFATAEDEELRWLTYLLTDLGEGPRSPPVLYVDNKAMLALCHKQRLEHRTKHIALRYFLSCDLQQRRQLRLSYVASRANTANVFTKALGSGDHQRFCTALGLVATLPHLLVA
ncbi:unnamed protein product [Closterium sp. NIES-54]